MRNHGITWNVKGSPWKSPSQSVYLCSFYFTNFSPVKHCAYATWSGQGKIAEELSPVKFNCLANCQRRGSSKTMQIPLNFITNCCKLKRVLLLLALLFCLLPVEKFDFLPENRRPLKLFAVTKKKREKGKGRKKSNE